jgi:hypothetical protein
VERLEVGEVRREALGVVVRRHVGVVPELGGGACGSRGRQTIQNLRRRLVYFARRCGAPRMKYNIGGV